MSFLDSLKSLFPKTDPAQVEFQSKINEIVSDGVELSPAEQTTIREALATLRANGGDEGEAMKWLKNRGQMAPGISARPAFKAIVAFVESDMHKIDR